VTKNIWVSVRGAAVLAALVALAGCNFQDTWTGSIKDPSPPAGTNPNHPPPNPTQPDDSLPQPGTGNATLAWIPPLENTDGTPLQDLTGYRIHYGTQPGNYEFTITIHNAGITSYVVEDLAPGTYYFAVTAVSSSGVESDPSGEATKTI
jgi:hypothetical protein